MTTDNNSEGIRYVIIDENVENGERSDSYSFTVSGSTVYHQNILPQQQRQQHDHVPQQQQQMLRYNFPLRNGQFLACFLI